MGEKEYLFCPIAQQTNTYTQLTIETEKLWNMFNVNNKDTGLKKKMLAKILLIDSVKSF